MKGNKLRKITSIVNFSVILIMAVLAFLLFAVYLPQIKEFAKEAEELGQSLGHAISVVIIVFIFILTVISFIASAIFNLWVAIRIKKTDKVSKGTKITTFISGIFLLVSCVFAWFSSIAYNSLKFIPGIVLAVLIGGIGIYNILVVFLIKD